MNAKWREREMTKRDWMALYVAQRLAEEIVLHGEVALENFIAAAAEIHAVRSEADPKKPR